jgi:AraC-like DNA-binding protein
MLGDETPLSAHPLIRTRTAVDLCREVREKIGAVCTPLSAASNFDVCINRYELPSGELWSSQTAAAVQVTFPNGPYFRIQTQLTGEGTTYLGRHPIRVSAVQSCISPAAAVVEHSPGFRQLEWRVLYDALARKLVALTGVPMNRKLVFVPAAPRNSPAFKAFLSILDSVVANIEHPTPLAPPFVLAELEEALMVSLLFNFEHNARDVLTQQVLDAGSWQVKRVEEYLEAHLDVPFDIAQIAEVTGIGVRSIYRAFQRGRGYSPRAFARQRRLMQARRLLEDGDAARTVTSVAFECGYNDVGHFSREFSKAFGKSPSAVLGKRSR